MGTKKELRQNAHKLDEAIDQLRLAVAKGNQNQEMLKRGVISVEQFQTKTTETFILVDDAIKKLELVAEGISGGL